MIQKSSKWPEPPHRTPLWQNKLSGFCQLPMLNKTPLPLVWLKIIIILKGLIAVFIYVLCFRFVFLKLILVFNLVRTFGVETDPILSRFLRTEIKYCKNKLWRTGVWKLCKCVHMKI